MDFIERLRIVSSATAFILVLSSCTSPSIRTSQPSHEPSYSETAKGAIRIGSWNLQRFGRTKANRPGTMAVLVAEIRKYDLIALQEIKDSSGESWRLLLDHVNGGTNLYDGIVSPVGSERYAFIFRKDRIRLKSSYSLPADQSSLFSYPPYSAYFGRVDGSADFLAMNIHTRPSLAREEINALPAASQSILSLPEFENERDVVILGDFNADCNYFDESHKVETEREGFVWITADSEVTNLAGGCTYDRIIISDSLKSDFGGSSGVSPIDPKHFFSDGYQVSDHFPIFAELFTERVGN